MEVITNQSAIASHSYNQGVLSFSRPRFTGFSRGTNKAEEYSWFYLLCLRGSPGENITLLANPAHNSDHYSRSDGLVYYSPDRWQWQRLEQPVSTDLTSLKQQYTFTFSDDQPVYISNTIFYGLGPIQKFLNNYANQHRQICRLHSLGSSVLGHDLSVLTFSSSRKPLGRILVTTGCHPAEPDIICSLALLDFLKSPASSALRQKYQIDVMPMQNPDGYAINSCLTANGVNLYWNFLKNDLVNCPEAFHLWRYIADQPPLLYLDFHAYVHQSHRHPQPYLQPLTHYRGHLAKSLVRLIDRRLIRLSGGNFHYGRLTAWPDALSYFVTNEFNTIAYTKYHIQLKEGIEASRQRALNVFKAAAGLVLSRHINYDSILLPPFGQARPDFSDRRPWRLYYFFPDFFKKIISLSRAYLRYYLHP